MRIFKETAKVAVASLIALTMVGCAATSAQKSTPKQPSEKVIKLVKKHNLEIVDYNYVTKAMGDGTRKGATSVIIDARPMKKYDMAHIPSSYALPDSKFDKMYGDIFAKVAKDKEIITYCGGYACAKSAKVAAMLKKKGHTNLKVYAAGMPEWKKKNYVEISQNVAAALFNKKAALFIDARPYGKFAGSTIVGSMGVPDTKFDKYSKFMPHDKSAVIITYCGGFKCHKSHSVANKLVAMGYTNVKVLASGFPAWKKSGLPVTGAGKKAKAASKKPTSTMSKSGVIKKGEDTGTVDGKWFAANYTKLPKSVTLVDVRDPKIFAQGTLKGAINIQAEKLTPKQLLEAIPATGDVVFFCGTGTRALEARGFLDEDLKYKGIDRIWYFDANIECKGNDCKIQPNEPLGV